jgi:hypothetical protein
MEDGRDFLMYGEMDALLRSFRQGPGSCEASVTWASGRTETVVASPGRTAFLKNAEAAERCHVTAWVIRCQGKVTFTVQVKQEDGIVYGGMNTIVDGKSTVKVYAVTDAKVDDGLAGCTDF